MGRNIRWRLGFALFYLVVTCLPPFSYAPNAVGLYQITHGNYSYDPSSPWTNHFAATWHGPDPRPVLAKTLDSLIGKTGLDPLDAAHPLVSYRVEQVSPLPDNDALIAQIEFRYTDDSARMYRYLVRGRGACRPECGAGGWIYTDLDAFRSEHKALPGLPLVDATSPITLGTPQRLPIPYDAQHFAALAYLGAAGQMLSTYNAVDAFWAPDKQSFLLLGSNGGSDSDYRPVLWHIALDGSWIQRVDGEVISCAWEAGGTRFVYLRRADSEDPGYGLRWFTRYQIVIVDAATGGQMVAADTFSRDYSVVGDAVYYLQTDDMLPKTDARLWRKPLDDRPAQAITVLTDMVIADNSGYQSTLAVSPDGKQVIYRCGTALCLTDIANTTSVQLDLDSSAQAAQVQIPPPPPPPLSLPGLPPRFSTGGLGAFHAAWSHDGSRLAIVGSYSYSISSSSGIPSPSILWILDAAGRTRSVSPIGSINGISTTQWTPDDRFLVTPSFPYGGRRIVGVEAASGQVWDLTQPKWDAFSSLSPDGKQVLLWNGRGGFWTADLFTKPTS